ncbi:MBL fold metallo-hydrolase [uncultured Chitinophaga sp.]|jgi:Metal-dependent hydrolases of the beta-lactamase superfamily I|uniref:MBL fold metallo-hydrolase n=1 Tax=uncultured Chitinophaga sp. TaxID=339340 RepID=UPI0026383AD7|nr:MBL fold metallo-hydrolase [uncultured Chitinophaga sp.]
MSPQVKKAPKKIVARPINHTVRVAGKIDRVAIRMYCLGTGDCFVLKFFSGKTRKYTMMIDCGSCKGGPAEFKPFLQDLVQYVNNSVDLLVITHEHNDHVNGFAKHPDIFRAMEIKEAWFAWTENPEDPDGAAQELLKKRSSMRMALQNAIHAYKKRHELMRIDADGKAGKTAYDGIMLDNSSAFINGLNTLASINLAGEDETEAKALPGMRIIKEILEQKKVKIRYLCPGDIVTISQAAGIKFYVLGPPQRRDLMFKNGKEGRDVYERNIALNQCSLAMNAFISLKEEVRNDVPFAADFVVEGDDLEAVYKAPVNRWRKIDDDWLSAAGSLALRLNSHINNTSLALAIESVATGNVLLFPGDAEYGSWESWHQIRKWEKKGRNGKHLTEDLLNRTIFYKVGHHLSYNGTALEKGILMMESDDLAAMATLDRKNIAEKWKGTMPNKLLLKELIKRCQGRVFLMNEYQITNRPSLQLDPHSLGEKIYEEGRTRDGKTLLYKQYVITSL